MFKFRTAAQQLREVQKQNAQLQQEARQNRADLDFVAAMCDVEIPEDGEEVSDNA